MPTTPSALVTAFLEAFLSGEIDRARAMVTEDFSFRAPLHQGSGDQAAYFAGAEHKTRFIRAFRILRQWVDGDQVATFYELDVQTREGAATMAMSEWHTLRDGRLASTCMVFDSNAKAATLLRAALGAQH